MPDNELTPQQRENMQEMRFRIRQRKGRTGPAASPSGDNSESRPGLSPIFHWTVPVIFFGAVFLYWLDLVLR